MGLTNNHKMPLDDELKMQISLGTINAISHNKLATMIKHATDLHILEWAFKHNSAKVRAAAIENLNLPIGLFIHAGLFNDTQTEHIAYKITLDNRHQEIIDALKIVTNYPQLSLKLNESVTSKRK